MLTQLFLALVALVHAWEEWDDVLQGMEANMNKLSFLSFLQLLAEESCGSGAGFKLTGVACALQSFFYFSWSVGACGHLTEWEGGFFSDFCNLRPERAGPGVYCARILIEGGYYCTKASLICANIAKTWYSTNTPEKCTVNYTGLSWDHINK